MSFLECAYPPKSAKKARYPVIYMTFERGWLDQSQMRHAGRVPHWDKFVSLWGSFRLPGNMLP
jgi:hypothetical protein